MNYSTGVTGGLRELVFGNGTVSWAVEKPNNSVKQQLIVIGAPAKQIPLQNYDRNASLIGYAGGGGAVPTAGEALAGRVMVNGKWSDWFIVEAGHNG